MSGKQNILRAEYKKHQLPAQKELSQAIGA
jgi:hypothetical protein